MRTSSLSCESAGDNQSHGDVDAELRRSGADVPVFDHLFLNIELIQDHAVHQGPHQVQRYDPGQGVKEYGQYLHAEPGGEAKAAYAYHA